MLKRKNEEDNVSETPSSATKRVALDAEVLEDMEGVQNDADLDGVQEPENNNNGSSDNNHSSDHEESSSKRISSHKVDTDPTFTYLRMLCQVKEAGLIVGKGGETISHIKEVSQTRINISENIRGVMERIVHVRGPSENVSKAFGLITRVILDEDENTPSSSESRSFDLQILIPHPIMGYVIGKQGLNFRDIENKSAAKLSTTPNSLPFSHDRLLKISGVADAIHIATYYVAQTILEHKSMFKGNFIYYDPGSILQHQQQLQSSQQHAKNGLPPNGLLFNNLIPYGGIQPPLNQPQFFSYGNMNRYSNNQRNNLTHKARFNKHPQQLLNQFAQQQIPALGQQQNQPFISLPPSPISPFPIGLGPITQEIYIPNDYVGNVIGKSGKNIKHIHEVTGSRITIGDPDPSSSERKITITGSNIGNQNAVILINTRIETDRINNEAKAKHLQSQLPSNSPTDTQIRTD